MMTIDFANTFYQRFKGLLGQKLSPNTILCITKCSSIHTLGMKEAIDLIFVDGNFKILKSYAHVKPRRIRLCWHARHCLEMQAGVLTQANTLDLVQQVQAEYIERGIK